VENKIGFRSRGGIDQMENEGLTEDALRDRSEIMEPEELKMGKGVGHRRHDKRNEARKEQNWQ
jgi:hypothetical protein